jgi:hypothetical protein
MQTCMTVVPGQDQAAVQQRECHHTVNVLPLQEADEEEEAAAVPCDAAQRQLQPP